MPPSTSSRKLDVIEVIGLLFAYGLIQILDFSFCRFLQCHVESFPMVILEKSISNNYITMLLWILSSIWCLKSVSMCMCKRLWFVSHPKNIGNSPWQKLPMKISPKDEVRTKKQIASLSIIQYMEGAEETELLTQDVVTKDSFQRNNERLSEQINN